MADIPEGAEDKSKLRQAFEQAAAFPPKNFPHEIGVELQKYLKSEPASYAAVNFHQEQGGIHGVHAEVKPTENKGLKIDIDHWVHRPDGHNILTRVLEIETVTVADANGMDAVKVRSIKLQGKDLDVNDRNQVDAALRVCRETIGQIRQHAPMPRLASIAEKAGLKLELPDTYSDGQARFDYEAGIRKARKYLRVPAKFVQALTGFGSDLSSSASLTDPDNANIDYFATSELSSAVDSSTVASLSLTRKDRSKTGDDREQVQEVCKLGFSPTKNAEFVALSNVTFDGRELPLSDHQAMVRTLKFVRDANQHMSRGNMPDMSEIIRYTKLQDTISGVVPLKRKEKARHTFRVMGGSPDGPRLYKQDESIGANSFLHKFEWFDENGDPKSKSVLIDWGITPIKGTKTGVDGMLAYLGYHFKHRHNVKNEPKEPIEDVVVTHHHIDHFMGLIHAMAAGYIIPNVICNEATWMYIKSEARKLGVPKDWMPQRWTKIGNPRVKSKEELEEESKLTDEELELKSRKEPTLTVSLGEFKLDFGWMSHSAITNWVNVKTPEGSVLHLSDSKRDDTIQSHEPVDPARLQELKPTITLMDSTHSGDDYPTKTEKELEDNIVAFLEKNPGKNTMAFHIGSNAARMVTLSNAFARTKRNVIVMGRALQFLKTVLEKVGLRDGFSLKRHFNEVQKKLFDSEIVETVKKVIINFSPKSKNVHEMLYKDAPGTVAVLATGTHNEDMSIGNRVVEDKDLKNLGFLSPDKWTIIMSQTGIPGNTTQHNLQVDTLRARGFDVLVEHSSGHGGKPDAIAAIKDTDSRYYMPTHGDNAQRAATAEVIREQGKIALNPNEQDVIQVSDKNGCKIVGQQSSTMVYFSVNRPDGIYFGGREDVEYYPHRVAPLIRSEVGSMIREINRIKRDDVASANPHETTVARLLAADSGNASALNDTNTEYTRTHMSLPDFLVTNGILRRLILDAETTQRSTDFAWMTQVALLQRNWLDPEEPEQSINIRQTLPRHVLPDLEALLKTKLAPSDIYKTGPGYYAPRQFMHEFMKALRQSQIFESGEHRLTRMFVENKKPDDPSLMKPARGLKNPYLQQSIACTIHAGPVPKGYRAVSIKTNADGFNSIKFDNPIISQALFRAGYPVYSALNTKGIRHSDIRNMARIFAYLLPDKFKTEFYPADPARPGIEKIRNFTVEGVARANNLKYDAQGAHDADADNRMEDAILMHMVKLDPELFLQCLMNTDDVGLKNFLKPAGMMDTRSLVTYVNNRAQDACANIGVYVGHSKNEKFKNKAVLFNVSDFDPKEFQHMTAEVFAGIMSDPKHKLHRAFEIVDLKKHPLIVSAHRGLAAGANHGTPIDTLEARKRFLSGNITLSREIVRGLEMARMSPDRDPLNPVEQRIHTPPFMKMSGHDADLAAYFTPHEKEFTDKDFADGLNRTRAKAIDSFHDHRLRERYVAVLYQAEKEFQALFGEERKYLHKQERARQKALEKARVHGRIPRGRGFIGERAVSLGQLKWQISQEEAVWETKHVAGKTPEERAKMEQILRECKELVADIERKIAAEDPDWAMTKEDLRLLGLDDNKPYGRYQVPLARAILPPFKPSAANGNGEQKPPQAAPG